MITRLGEYRKAVAAFLVPALVSLSWALADGRVSWQEWCAVAIAALGTPLAVGALTNDPYTGGTGGRVSTGDHVATGTGPTQ